MTASTGREFQHPTLVRQSGVFSVSGLSLMQSDRQMALKNMFL
jgi:hypothetical protein